jgi:hypothetical protein
LKVIVETTEDGKLFVRVSGRIVAGIFFREDGVEQLNPAGVHVILRPLTLLPSNKGYALVETYREGGRVKQRVLAYLRGSPSLADAAAGWRERARWYERRVNDARRTAQKHRRHAFWARKQPFDYRRPAQWYERCAERAEALAVREQRLLDEALAEAARFEALIPRYGHLEAPGADEIRAERQALSRSLEELCWTMTANQISATAASKIPAPVSQRWPMT